MNRNLQIKFHTLWAKGNFLFQELRTDRAIKTSLCPSQPLAFLLLLPTEGIVKTKLTLALQILP